MLVRRAASHFRSAVFQFFDHTGDIGVDIDAADPGALFADAARAFSETITDREALDADEIVEVSLSADAIDLLLVDWLSELVYRFDAERLAGPRCRGRRLGARRASGRFVRA